MPRKRRDGKHRAHAITPEAIAAFEADDETTLHSALGLKPWYPSPLVAVGDCPWPEGTGGADWWPFAVELRAELLNAIAERD